MKRRRAALGATPPPDFRRVNRSGGTALIPTCHCGHVERVRLLLAHKADPNLVDREGATPLAHALQRGQRDIAQLLRAAGARTTR